MKIDFRHLLVAVLLCCLGYYLLSDWGPSTDSQTAPESVKARVVADPQVAADYHAYQEDLQARIQELSRMEAEQQRGARVAAKSLEARQQLAVFRQNAWSDLVAANRAKFEALREKARSSPRGETHCTLCNGRGSMAFCLVCCNNSGLCVTCDGLGRDSRNEPCPTCLGTRKCFNCLGTGKMLCPFCDDGGISAKSPFPPRNMPVR